MSGTGHAEARRCLLGICETLGDFKKVCSMSQEGPFVGKSCCKWLGWTHNLGEAGSEGITKTGPMETQLWLPPAHTGCMGVGLNKGMMASDNTSVWRKASLLALALNPYN